MRFAPGDRVVVMRDMNLRVGDMPIKGVVGPWRVPGVNTNRECSIYMCQEIGMIVGSTWCKEKRKNEYMWERENPRDEVLMNYLLIERELRDVNVL